MKVNPSKYSVLDGGARYTFNVEGPLFCPYHNVWGRNVYTLNEPFVHNPFTIPASSTSGSPVLIDAAGKFFGFMNDRFVRGAEFIYDGKSCLTIAVPEGQQLWVDESGEPDSCKRYNREILRSLPANSSIRNLWCDIEYCTWVEQKALANVRGVSPFEVLDHGFIESYIRQINDLGLPRGKLTIDHGWQNGDETYGDWEAHPERFPDLARTIGLIRDSGFAPGLWMSPIWLHPDSSAARHHPEWLGPKIHPATPDSPVAGDWNYFQPQPGVQEHLERIFARFHRMGVMKFKFDMTYANKEFMKALHRIIYRAVKNVSEEIEVEIHQPDIFFTPWCDAVRTNDILCNNHFPWWRELTQVHMEICCKSAPGRVINLDHIGGNDPAISQETFLEHLGLFQHAIGHPVVSMIPARLGAGAVKGLRSYLEAYLLKREAVSLYY